MKDITKPSYKVWLGLIQGINYWLNAIVTYVPMVPWETFPLAKEGVIRNLEKALQDINNPKPEEDCVFELPPEELQKLLNPEGGAS